jgi:Zn-dependent oligopeptidase
MKNSEIKMLVENPDFLDFETLSSKESLRVYISALEEFLEQAKEDFAKIVETPKQEATFENVAEAFLQQDESVSTLWTFLHHINSTNATETTRKIIQDFQPKMVEYSNLVSLSPEFFALLEVVESTNATLDSEQKRSLELLLKDMKSAGVHLKGEKKKRLEEINHRLAELSERFSNNVLDSRKEFSYHFSSDASFGEMPESDRQGAQEEAQQRKKEGWVFTLSPPSYQAILQYCTDREVRKKFWEANVHVASEGELSNKEIILDVLKLRKEKAELMGFDTYAHYVLEERMAESPKQVFSVLNDFAERAKKKAQAEWMMLQDFSGLSDMSHWDTAYYSEKLKKQEFQIDNNELRKYFPLEQVIDGLFQTANTLFGLTFQKREAKLYDDSAMAYDVFWGEKQIAYFLFDLFARPEKRGGAWCNDLRHGRKGVLPIVVNVSNFSKGTKTQPPLLTHYDVQTMFHEFGHGLHVMLSSNGLSNTNGFHTEWDFVELPSQLFENWTWETEGLCLFAKHFESGEPLPKEMISSLNKSRKFLKGLFLLRQNEFGFLDFLLHTEEPPKSVEELHAKTLKIANTYSVLEKPDYYSVYTSFGHIFGGGYAAGYYSYLWAEILEADVFTRFQKEGVLNPKIGKEYAEKILHQGAKKSGADIFRDFMGRDPKPDALLEKLGLTE